jgi:hypothetical protein
MFLVHAMRLPRTSVLALTAKAAVSASVALSSSVSSLRGESLSTLSSWRAMRLISSARASALDTVAATEAASSSRLRCA